MEEDFLDKLVKIVLYLCILAILGCSIFMVRSFISYQKHFDESTEKLKEIITSSYSDDESNQQTDYTQYEADGYEGEVTITREQYDSLLEQSKELEQIKSGNTN